MMTHVRNQAHIEWHTILTHALGSMDSSYLQNLHHDAQALPKNEQRFAAFQQPLSKTRYILFGESPYPRAQSANGYAFWDAAVGPLWSQSGLSKPVNRATSLRNLIKMMLHARGDLRHDFSQSAIAQLDTTQYVQTGDALFQNLIAQGFLLLNASLVYRPAQVTQDARQWRPFMSSLLSQLAEQRPDITLVLLGQIAKKLSGFDAFPHLIAEHPYQISFITNPAVLDFFNPFDLLKRP